MKTKYYRRIDNPYRDVISSNDDTQVKVDVEYRGKNAYGHIHTYDKYFRPMDKNELYTECNKEHFDKVLSTAIAAIKANTSWI